MQLAFYINQHNDMISLYRFSASYTLKMRTNMQRASIPHSRNYPYFNKAITALAANGHMIY
jgi:hypothetical protein